MNNISQMVRAAQLRVNLVIAQSCLDAFVDLGLNGERLMDAFDDRDEASYFLHQHEKLIEQREEEARHLEEMEWLATHSWLDDVERRDSTFNLVERAAKFVQQYLQASHDSEFGYDCNVNPEGITSAKLDELEEEARNRMMAALSMITDDQIEAVLEANQDRDHDGSRYFATRLSNVRTWQDIQTKRGNVIKPLITEGKRWTHP